MREIFTHQDFTSVSHYKSVLDSKGIPSFIRNGLSNHSLTELSAPILFPTLFVENDGDYDRAMEILNAIHNPPAPNIGSIPRGEARRAVDILRGLLVAKCLLVIGFLFAGNSVFQNFEIYNRNKLTGLERAYSSCNFPVEILVLISCFCLMRIGRIAYLFHIALCCVLLLGNTGCIINRAALPIVLIASLITGAILAMLFLSPAAVCFQKKRD